MTEPAAKRGARAGYPHPRLRVAALTAVIVGVLLLAAAAFVLSYSGIHQIALGAGVTPELARLYPAIFDAMLVIAGSAALTLRGASWWMRCYVWLSLLVLLGAVAGGDAVHAMNLTLPRQPSRAGVAVTPWLLLLLGFGLWLAMLRQARRPRAGAPGATAAAGDGAGLTWAGRGTAGLRPGGSHATIEDLLGPRVGEEPVTVPVQAEAGAEHTYIVHEDYPLAMAGRAGDPVPDEVADGADGRLAAGDGPDDGQSTPVPAAPAAFDRMHSTPTPPHPAD
jgi:hypothetical protein